MSSRPGVPPSSARSPLILHVEDRDAARFARSAMLRQKGFDVAEAATGRGALDDARRLQPRALLMDVNLPDIDGREVCRQLKGDPDLSHIPVVLVSAVVRAHEAAQDSSMNADAFLAEPISADTLAATLHRVIAASTVGD